MEAGFPLYGHEMGVDPDGQRMPIFAVPLAKFAVSFAPQKGDFIGRKALERQFDAFRRIMNRDFSDCTALPRRILPIALLDRGVMRAGMAVYRGEKQVGWVTSGTMVPYYVAEGEGLETVITEETAKRAIGLCYVDSDVLTDDVVEVDIRGRRLKAVIPARHMSVGAPPYARPLLYRRPEDEVSPTGPPRRWSCCIWRRITTSGASASASTSSLRRTPPAGRCSCCQPAIPPAGTLSTRRSSPSMIRMYSTIRAPSSSTPWSNCWRSRCASIWAALRWRPVSSAGR